MKKFILYILLALLLIAPVNAKNTRAQNIAEAKKGYILLQVEKNGEAWYVHPENQKRYYLGRPYQAFEIMKNLSLGAKHNYIASNDIFPERLSGMILLDVERNGEAYYIYPENRQKYYLGRPSDAFRIMRELGLGITNTNLNTISAGDVNEPIEKVRDKVLIEDVSFTPQAPFGNWEDKRQQDGCEEASALMAVRWAQNQNLTKQEALNMITDSSDFLEQKYGEYRDVTTRDTVNWIIKDYLDYDKVELKENITKTDIIAELDKGNLVMLPMNGQIVDNPYFTPPGPSRHMLLVKGYDKTREVFITNDPGTRNGESFEYSFDNLYNGIRDYPTGYHEPISQVEKNMIVVWK